MRRREMLQQGRLPAEYQEVEWIRGNSYTQNANYIDLNNNSVLKTSKIECEFEYQSGLTYSYDRIIGSSYSILISAYYYNSTTISRIEAVKYRNDVINIPIEKDTVYNIVFDGDDVYLNNELVGTHSSQTGYEERSNLYILNGGNRSGQTRIYFLKLWDTDGTLIRNMIPCYRKSDGEIGMYDLVGKTFYTNAGTGTFTKGADVL